MSGGEVGIMFLSGSWGEVAEGNVVQHHRVLNQSAAKHEVMPYRVHILYVLHRVENYSDRVSTRPGDAKPFARIALWVAGIMRSSMTKY